MAQDVIIAGVTYSGVPSINVPKVGGGVATFIDATIEEESVDWVSNNVINSTNFVMNMRKSGNLVLLQINCTPTSTNPGTSTFTTVGQIPSGWRPKWQVYQTVALQSNTNSVVFSITTAGEVRILKGNTATSMIRANIPYWVG